MQKDNSPAFPVGWRNQEGNLPSTGMTLRDYFAGQAITGLLFNKKAFENTDMSAKWAYEIADAMLAERNTPNGQG